MAALEPLGAQTVDPRGVYRVFLTDGRALPSYGEPTTLAGRIAFVLVIGDPRAKSELQLISVPASAVDLRRTERYTDFLRGQQYAVTGGPTDYSAFTAEMTVTLADIEREPDPRRRLDLALEARRRIADWPAAHRFYRVGDVRTMLRGLDTIIADLARSAGRVMPPGPIIAEPPRYEPEVPLPGARDWVELSLAAAAATGDSDTRATILRNALSVAGPGEAASQIRAELARVTGQAAPVVAPPMLVRSPPAVKATPAAAKPAPAKPAPDKVAVPAAAPPGVAPPRAPAKASATPAPPPLETAPRVVAAPIKSAPTPEPASAKASARLTPVPAKVIEAPKPKVEAPKFDPAPATPVVPAPGSSAPVASAPAAAPIVATPAAASSPRATLAAVAIGAVVLAAAVVAFRVLRRGPAGPALVPPAAAGAAEGVAPEPRPAVVPVPAPALAPVAAPAPLPLPVPVAASDGPQGLELVAVREAQFYGYRFVEGEIKNVSNRVLENLEVAVRWYVSQGALLATDAAVIDAGALQAGRTVPFRVLTRSSPGMASYSLHFTSKGDVVAQFQKPGRP